MQYFIKKDRSNRNGVALALIYGNYNVLLYLLQFGYEVNEPYIQKIKYNYKVRQMIFNRIEKLKLIRNTIEKIWIDVDITIIILIENLIFGQSVQNLQKYI